MQLNAIMLVIRLVQDNVSRAELQVACDRIMRVVRACACACVRAASMLPHLICVFNF